MRQPYKGREEKGEREFKRNSPANSETARKISLLTELQLRNASRNRLAQFCTRVYPDYETPLHIRIMCHYLEQAAARKINRLIISMPPRHSKTQTSSILFPAWYLGNFPQHQIIAASYAEPLALNNSQACRDTITSTQFQTLWQHKLDVKGSIRWRIAGKNNKRPNFIAAGVGGAISGEGADVFIIDDPIKNYEEAYSVVYRDKIWDWYRTVARTRLQPKAVVIIIMTRWHHDDLAGRLLRLAQNDPKADQWTELVLPSEDPDGTEQRPAGIMPPYAALWPERYPVEELDKTAASLGSLMYGALYRQRPSDVEGQIIKRAWFRYYRDLPVKLGDYIQSWDMSFKDTTDSSFVVGQVWARAGADKYLIYQVRKRMAFAETVNTVKTVCGQYPQAYAKLVEDKANGPAVISALRHQIGGFIPVEPMGSKEARLQAASVDFQSLNVYVPDPELNPWVRDLIEELCTFPASPNSDQCDATSQAMIRYRGGNSSLLRWLKGQFDAKYGADVPLDAPQTAVIQ